MKEEFRINCENHETREKEEFSRRDAETEKAHHSTIPLFHCLSPEFLFMIQSKSQKNGQKCLKTGKKRQKTA
ncbi:MAG: hypothetical protein AB7T27_03510 [Kiritimatiellia bacterium]